MANTFNNINEAAGILAKAAAQTLVDNLVFCDSISKADASDFDGKNGYSAGNTIYTSKPARYIPQNTIDVTSSIQDSVEEKVPLVLDQTSTVAMEFGSLELATDVDLKSIAQRFVIPAAQGIAQDIETRCRADLTNSVYNSTGAAGSNAFTIADVLAGRTKMNQNLAPYGDERHFISDSESGAKAVDARKALFQSADEIGKQYKEGMVGKADGFMWYESELGPVHTNGNDVTGVAIDMTVTEGLSTIHVDGLTTTSGTITKGTVFTIATVFMVHPITKVLTNRLQQFVVTADVTADGAGDVDLPISPALYAASGGLKNVSNLPADNAAIVFVGAASTGYAQNLQYHRDAFKMVTVPMVMPTGAEFAAQETVDGITVSVVRDFDILKRRFITRLDILCGWTAVRPEWANRVTS